MATLLDAFMGGAQGSNNLRLQNEYRNTQQQQIALNEEAAQRTRNVDTANQAAVLARQLDITDDGGLTINQDKLTAKLEEQRNNNAFDPKVQQLFSILGNEDLTVKNNPDFEFTGLAKTPDGNLTLAGAYKNEPEKGRFFTFGREKGDDAIVAAAPVKDIVELASNQYNQAWTKPGVSDLYNEMDARMRISGASQEQADNSPKLRLAVSQLTNELEQAIAATAGDDAARINTNLKNELKGVPYYQQLQILQSYGEQLQIPSVKEVVTPDVVEAAQAAEAEATTQPSGQTPATATEPEKEPEKEPEQDQRTVAQQNRDKRIENARAQAEEKQKQKRIAELEEELAKPLPDRARQPTVAARKRKEEELAQLKGQGQKKPEEIKDPDPQIESAAKASASATDKDIIEGKVQFTKEQIASLQARLKDKGITDLNGIVKASYEEQQAMRGMIAVLAKDPEARKNALEQFDNVIATGNPDYNTKELQEARVAQQNADSSTLKAQTGAYSAETGRMNTERLTTEMFSTFAGNTGTFIGEKVKRITDLFTGEDGEAVEPEVEDVKSAMFGQGGAASSLWGKAKNQLRILNRDDASPQEKKAAQMQLNMLQQALLAQLSFGMQFLSADDGLEISVLATDSGASLSGNDSALSRIARDGNGYIIVKPGTKGEQDGDRITDEQLANFFGDKELKGFFDQKLDEISKQRGF